MEYLNINLQNHNNSSNSSSSKSSNISDGSNSSSNSNGSNNSNNSNNSNSNILNNTTGFNSNSNSINHNSDDFFFHTLTHSDIDCFFDLDQKITNVQEFMATKYKCKPTSKDNIGNSNDSK